MLVSMCAIVCVDVAKVVPDKCIKEERSIDDSKSSDHSKRSKESTRSKVTITYDYELLDDIVDESSINDGKGKMDTSSVTDETDKSSANDGEDKKDGPKQCCIVLYSNNHVSPSSLPYFSMLFFQ